MNDTIHMMRCLELARLGSPWVHPNPMVGCVLVKDGRVIAEGYHRRFGGSHAEILALQSAGRRARGATLYANLEPCAHHGKTPPCADAIIEAGIVCVVVPGTDPNPLVSGRGFRKLRAAGIAVRTRILRAEARLVNEKFYFAMEQGKPFVGVKIAQTLDGRIADTRGVSKWITSIESRAYGHKLRSEYDAVLVGASTVRSDNPRLTVRMTKGKNPVRVILDGRLSAPVNARVFLDRESPTIVLTCARSLDRLRAKVIALERKGVQVLGIESGAWLRPEDILAVLWDLGMTSVLVEGGAQTSGTFASVMNRVHCFIAPAILGTGKGSFHLSERRLADAQRLVNVRIQVLGPDILLEGSPQ